MSKRIAVVTGAGSGIGRAVSLALIDDGYQVVLVGRRQEKLAETAARATESEPLVYPCDVTQASAVQQLFAEVKRKYGRVDLLFNNAGINKPARLDELSVTDWQQVVDVNLTAAFVCTREAFRIMKEQQPRGGRIINNGSISATTPRPNSVAYTATKHAITGLTKSTSLDGREFDIACGQIDIGGALTEMTANVHEGILQAHGAIVPEPTMDVDAVAKAVVYMAGLPLDANVLTMTVMATKMPYVGRG